MAHDETCRLIRQLDMGLMTTSTDFYNEFKLFTLSMINRPAPLSDYWRINYSWRNTLMDNANDIMSMKDALDKLRDMYGCDKPPFYDEMFEWNIKDGRIQNILSPERIFDDIAVQFGYDKEEIEDTRNALLVPRPDETPRSDKKSRHDEK